MDHMDDLNALNVAFEKRFSNVPSLAVEANSSSVHLFSSAALPRNSIRQFSDASTE